MSLKSIIKTPRVFFGESPVQYNIIYYIDFRKIFQINSPYKGKSMYTLYEKSHIFDKKTYTSIQPQGIAQQQAFCLKLGGCKTLQKKNDVFLCSWESKLPPPPKATPPINKALLRDY